MPPGSDAPGALETLRGFVNTLDLETGVDAIDTPAALGEWLTGNGLLKAGDTPAACERDEAVAVREALRALLIANNGGQADAGSFLILNAAAERAQLEARFGPSGADPLAACADGVAGAVGRILAIAHAAMADGTWVRLKACPDQGCQWAFYDHSRNGSGKWCSMAVCGNRNKGQTFRSRRRTASPPA
jgi:predicted RNA-binding Zn ribbon-like protein